MLSTVFRTAALSRAKLAPSSPNPKTINGVRTLMTWGKKEWLAIIPDKPHVGEIRKSVKGKHYEGIQPLISSGKLVTGGAIFDTHPSEGQVPVFKGSVVVYTGEAQSEILDIIKNDVYATSGVWDVEKVQIIPYVPAVRQALAK